MLNGTQKLKYLSSISNLEFHPAFKAIKALSYVIDSFDDNSKVFVAVNLHTVEFISIFFNVSRT